MMLQLSCGDGKENGEEEEEEQEEELEDNRVRFDGGSK